MTGRWEMANRLGSPVMNRVLLIASTLVLWRSVASAQTNLAIAAAPGQLCPALNLPRKLEPQPPAISLQRITNPLRSKSPSERSETPAEAAVRQARHGGFWEEAATAYHREETGPDGRDGGGAPRAKVRSPTQLAPLRGDMLDAHHAYPLKLPDGPKVVSDSSPRPTFALSNQTISEANPTELALMRRMEREGLMRPAGPTYGSDVERKIAEAFRPEIIHVGHVHICSSIITAIARKNPLCLLDPDILGISF
jgi:hypothetical protein